MSEARCETCRHWKRDDPALDQYGDPNNPEDVAEERETALGRVYLRAWLEGWRECGFIPHTEDQDEGDALAVSCDGSGYMGYLLTHPDFFCAHWKPQEG